MCQVLYSLLLAFSAVLLINTPARAGIFDFGSDCGNNKTHNFFYGNKSFYDRQFYTAHVIQPSSFLRKTSIDYTYPPKGVQSGGMITYISALDQNHDGNGGCVYIKNGGVGQRNVTLHLKSKRNYGIDFIISIYGH